MGTVLYEVGFQFETALVIPLVVLVAFVVILKVKWQETPIVPKILFSAVACFLLAVCILMYQSQWDMYTTVTNAYENGDYQTVEGYVENFHPMPPEGHDVEFFDIDGVHFSYSDATVMTGYHNAKINGGVITGDGQHLKIGYIYYNELYGNIIVYIEEVNGE